MHMIDILHYYNKKSLTAAEVVFDFDVFRLEMLLSFLSKFVNMARIAFKIEGDVFDCFFGG